MERRDGFHQHRHLSRLWGGLPRLCFRPAGGRLTPEILFQDKRFVVLNKPPGLPVHPGPRGGPSVEDWFPLLSRRHDGPWLAHRLDADTAGCLVIALRRAPLLAAQKAFAEGRAEKTYWAVVRGRPSADSGTVEAALAKCNTRSGWRMASARDGKPALTDWRVLAADADHAWLELHPRTGRTHQVRVHCAELGCPVLGDPIYGDGQGPLHLLARAITLPLDPILTATAPVPPHMRHKSWGPGAAPGGVWGSAPLLR